MNTKITLQKATIKDAEEIHQMQLKAFEALLEKYQDNETNPGNEKLAKTIQRLNMAGSDYFILKLGATSVGAVRILHLDKRTTRKIAPIFIVPEYQNKGIAQQAFQLLETKYKSTQTWLLETVLEENRNCYLYEKIGYTQTGERKKVNDKLTLVYYRKTL